MDTLERVSLIDLVDRKEPVTRDELVQLFHRYVCRDTCPFVVGMMDDNLLKRLIAVSSYKQNHQSGRNMTLVKMQLCSALNISRTTLWTWIKTYLGDKYVKPN